MFLPGFIVFKIIPNILAASILFPIYLIARKITGNINIALITAGVSGFIPLYIAQTYNTLSSYAVMFPLICLMIYFLIDPKPKYTKYYVLCSIVLALLGQFSFVFALSSILYILLLRIEHLKQDRIELELLLFSSFLIFWIQFFIYK